MWLFVHSLLLSQAVAQDVAVVGACPGPVELGITGVTPNASYAVLSGSAGGGQTIPGGPCAGVPTDMSGIKLRLIRDADGAGEGLLTPTLPGAVCSQAIQILDINSCGLSPARPLDCEYGSGSACPATSCLDILERGASKGDGIYWLSPDGEPPFLTQCDMTTDGGGWTLVAKVHTADADFVFEPVGWFGNGNNAGPLATWSNVINASPSSVGAARFADYLDAQPAPRARFDLRGQTDGALVRQWYKDAPSTAVSAWFADDTTATQVCDDVDLRTNCTSGTIAAGSTTVIEGMVLDETCGPIHMRLEGDVWDNLSGVCGCDQGAIVPSEYQTHWGHGMDIWLR